MREYPPILTGDEFNQIKQLRDYLVRLCNDLDQNQAQSVQTQTPTRETAPAGNYVSSTYFQEKLSQIRNGFIPTNGLRAHYTDIEDLVRRTVREEIGK